MTPGVGGGWAPAARRVLAFYRLQARLVWEWRPTRLAILRRTVLSFLMACLALAITTAVIPGMSIDGPASLVLAGLLLPAFIAATVDPGANPGVAFHAFSGATMLGAFFIATDPVSAATSDRGRLLYGAGIGLLTWIIRKWGAYPDGVAFAVLLMNLAVPLIDRYTIPRIHGHGPR